MSVYLVMLEMGYCTVVKKTSTCSGIDMKLCIWAMTFIYAACNDIIQESKLNLHQRNITLLTVVLWNSPVLSALP